MIAANELNRKQMILIDGEPYLVLDVFIALPSARGASTLVRTKVRHLMSGNVLEKTFKASEKFAEADVEELAANFLYKDSDGYCFMETGNYEMLHVSEDTIRDGRYYLTEELEVKILRYNSAVISIVFPSHVNLKVTAIDPGGQQQGFSAGGGTKQAILETGLAVSVPKYIDAGEFVRVNTETGEVTGRA